MLFIRDEPREATREQNFSSLSPIEANSCDRALAFATNRLLRGGRETAVVNREEQRQTKLSANGKAKTAGFVGRRESRGIVIVLHIAICKKLPLFPFPFPSLFLMRRVVFRHAGIAAREARCSFTANHAKRGTVYLFIL